MDYRCSLPGYCNRAATRLPLRAVGMRVAPARLSRLKPAASLQTAHLTVPAASHVHIPFAAMPEPTQAAVLSGAAATQQNSASSSNSKRFWFAGEQQKNEQEQEQQSGPLVEQAAAARLPAAQLAPQQLLHMQQSLLLHQQRQQQGPSPALAAIPVLLLIAGITAGYKHTWQATKQQQPAPLQQQQQQQQQQQRLEQLGKQLALWVGGVLAGLQSAASSMTGSTQQMAGKAARAAAQVFGRVSVTAAATSALEAISSSDASTTQQHQQLQQQQPEQQLPAGWWLSLEKVYYLNFGAHAGLLPRVQLPGKALNPSEEPAGSTAALSAQGSAKQQQEWLIAFESQTDAEYVRNVLQSSYIGSAVASGSAQLQDARRVFRGAVAHAKPWYLEDMAAVQHIGLEVLPQGMLRYDLNLTGPQLEHVLVQQLTRTAWTDERQQQQQQQQQDEDLQDMWQQQPQQQPSSTAVPKQAVAAADRAAGGFTPVSTDLPLFDLGDEFNDRLVLQASSGQSSAADALKGLMAAGAAAVPVQYPGSPGGSRQASKQQQQQQQWDQQQEEVQGEQPADRVAVASGSSAGLQTPAAEIAAAHAAGSAGAASAAAGAGRASVATEAAAAAESDQATVEAAQQHEAADVSDSNNGHQSDDMDDSSIADMLADYHKLKQQHPEPHTEQLNAAYARMLGTPTGEGDVYDAPSPTAIAAAAAADGVVVQTDDLADAVAAKFFSNSSSSISSKGKEDPRSRNRASSVGSSSSSSRNTVNAARGRPDGASGTAESSTSRPSADAAADVLASMQQQLEQLQRQAEVLRQQQQHREQQQQGLPGSAVGAHLGVQLQQLQQGITNLQQVAAAAAGVEQDPNYSELLDAPEALEAQQSESSSSSSSASLQSAPVTAVMLPSSSKSNTSVSNESIATALATTTDAAAAAAVLPQAGKASSSSSSSSSSSTGKRSWGAWVNNKRIKAANATLIKDSSRLEVVSQQAWSPQQPHGPAGRGGPASTTDSSRGAAVPVAAPLNTVAAQDDDAKASQQVPEVTAQGDDDAVVTEDGAKIYSRKLGVKRPKKVATDPLERQMLVKDALRAAAQQMAGDTDGSSNSSAPGSSSSGQPHQWWQERYQAVFLPSIRYQDGSVGFVQMDVSLNPAVKDVRVLTFEDRHDCMKCLTVMRQWPQLAGSQLTMGAMPSRVVEEQVRSAYMQQLSAAGGDTAAVGASLPSGIVVFRKGKLTLRVGMDEAEFTEVVVYQAAAQLALSNMGYRFDD